MNTYSETLNFGRAQLRSALLVSGSHAPERVRLSPWPSHHSSTPNTNTNTHTELKAKVTTLQLQPFHDEVSSAHGPREVQGTKDPTHDPKTFKAQFFKHYSHNLIIFQTIFFEQFIFEN